MALLKDLTLKQRQANIDKWILNNSKKAYDDLADSSKRRVQIGENVVINKTLQYANTPKGKLREYVKNLPAGSTVNRQELAKKFGIKNTPLGPVPTGDVGLNTSGRLGNLSATIDAIDALKGESVNPALNYSGNFGNTNVYGNYSDDAQNIGLNFNNDKGLSGGISYDAITGEPRFDIGFKKRSSEVISFGTRRRIFSNFYFLFPKLFK